MSKIRLEDIDKKVPYSAPEGYFDQLTSQIQDKIKEKPKRQWIPAGQVRWALAGAFSLFLIAMIVFYPGGSALSAEELLAEVSDEALIEYLDFAELSEFELIEGLDDSTIDELWEDTSLDPLQLEDLDQIDLDEYLTDYEIDNLL